uniref:Uncharacterized protein n=1 Tax=Macrostomum lignano TaxID=282301 RepID=A0A1I8JQA2_9PLAT
MQCGRSQQQLSGSTSPTLDLTASRCPPSSCVWMRGQVCHCAQETPACFLELYQLQPASGQILMRLLRPSAATVCAATSLATWTASCPSAVAAAAAAAAAASAGGLTPYKRRIQPTGCCRPGRQMVPLYWPLFPSPHRWWLIIRICWTILSWSAASTGLCSTSHRSG